MGLQGLNYKDILKNTLRAAVKITPITAAPQTSLHLGEETSTSLSLHPMLMQAAHPNCSSSSAACGVPSPRWIHRNARDLDSFVFTLKSPNGDELLA